MKQTQKQIQTVNAETEQKQFGSSIPTPILDEILERTKSPLLTASIDATTAKQRYYQTKVCCPCGREECPSSRTLRFRSSYKSWDGKWRPMWKEVPTE